MGKEREIGEVFSNIPVIAAKELKCDVLVVGGGTAGFPAAVKAAQEGAKVIVIEKNQHIGGEGLISAGAAATLAGGTDYQKAAGVIDSSELLYEEMRKWDPKANPEVLKAYAEHTAIVCHFLRDLGVEWNFRALPSADFGCSVGRHHGIKGRGPALYKALRPAFEEAGGKILTETKGVRLLIDAKGAVLGVTARDKEGTFNIKSKATILTCGGFQGNMEMVAKYISPDAVYALLRGLPTNTGDGILMGMEVGAATEAMERVHGYVHIVPVPMPYPFHPYAILPPDGEHAVGGPKCPLVANVSSREAHCIVVNIMGERFADETKPRLGEQMTNAILRQPEVRAYIIADQPLYEKHLKASVVHATRVWEELGYGSPQIEIADEIGDLAKKLGMNPSVLCSTVSEYNGAVQDGTTHLLKVPKANKDPLGLYQKLGLNFLHKIETPPFYAVSITAGVSHSLGGIVSNSKCQVVNREKKPILGLYAAGDTTVLWISNYGGGLPGAFVQGYIAGKNAAMYSKTPSS